MADARQKLVPPEGQTKVLLHSCCAPCSGEVMEAMLASGRSANGQTTDGKTKA